jgi:hypothetical protein
MPGGGMYLGSLSELILCLTNYEVSSVTGQNAMSVIGAPVTVWQAPAGKEWDLIQAVSVHLRLFDS